MTFRFTDKATATLLAVIVDHFGEDLTLGVGCYLIGAAPNRLILALRADHILHSEYPQSAQSTHPS